MAEGAHEDSNHGDQLRAAPDRPRLDRRATTRLLSGGLLGASLALSRPGGPRTAAQAAAGDSEVCPTPASPAGPTGEMYLYELNGPQLTIAYATSSMIGEPQLTIEDLNGQRIFVGDVIQVEETRLGKLVTVELNYLPDAGAELFSLLLPAVGQVAIAPEIAALAIYTTELTTIGGPNLIEGAIQLYRVVEVTGVARSVMF